MILGEFMLNSSVINKIDQVEGGKTFSKSNQITKPPSNVLGDLICINFVTTSTFFASHNPELKARDKSHLSNLSTG